jgi:5-methyltetrahydrofolate--homocysteine methyltransferase
MASQPLLDALTERPLLGDGAMGTQLFAAGLAPGVCGELWNLKHPDRIEAVHRAYADAGCDLLTTNTFGGCPLSLVRHNLADKAADMNRAAAEIARRVGGDDRWVLADIGPFGDFLEPLGTMTHDELLGAFKTQAAALHEGGADAALVETMADPGEVAVAVEAARAVADWPIIATFTFNIAGDSFRTMMGTDVADAMAAARDAGADIIGSNCGTDLSLDDYLRLAEQLVAAAEDKPVMLQPNAGAPILENGKTIHPATPDDMAALTTKLAAAGLRIIGGCCGTTPDHLRAMGIALRAG